MPFPIPRSGQTMNGTSPEVFHLFKGVPWLITYICETVLILTGNAVTIHIFWSIRKRMKRSSYLLINLAVADFLVGISISLFLFLHISSAAPILVINTVVKIGVFLDTVGVTSSILSLALISLERMLAMLWPFRHRTVKTWYYHLSVGIVWLLACFNGVVNVIIDLYRTKSQDGFSYLMAITLICSVLVITGTYLTIWFSIKRSNRFRSNTCRSMEQDRKLAKTLFIVTAFSVFTCLPSGISLALRDYLQNMYSFRIQITFVAQYANSFLNPVIYCFKIPEFQASLKKLLCSCQRQRLPFNEDAEATSVVTLRSLKSIEASLPEQKSS